MTPRITFHRPVGTSLAIALALMAGAAGAAEITGDRIFDKEHPRVEKVNKSLEAAEAAADAEFKQAQVRHWRTQLKACARAGEALAAEEAAALREGDSAGVVAVALRRKAVASKIDSLKTKLEEAGETVAPEPVKVAAKSVPKPVEKPVAVIPVAVVTETAASVKPAETAPAERPVSTGAPVEAVLADEVPILMLGRWKIVENGQTTGFVALSSTGQNKVFAAFRPSGQKEATGGAWRVSSSGEVTLIPDKANGTEVIQATMVSKTKAEGFRHTRKDESVPFRKGGAVELVREAK